MKSKIVIVTGASSGIGRATVKQLLMEGHRVYAFARRLEAMKDLGTLGATVVGADVCNEAQVSDIVSRVIKETGRIDVLINNAGFAIYGAVEDISIEDARRQFEVNLFALARITQLVLPYMREQGSGTIINMSSMGGKMYTPLGAWYHGTKHALEGWSDCLRLELKQFGIKVVLIEPGGIKTGFDGIMAASLMEKSGQGVYAGMATMVASGASKMYSKMASPPEVVSRMISRAVKARNPKTRYRGGFMAKPSVWIRTYLGDRLWDKLILGMSRFV